MNSLDNILYDFHNLGYSFWEISEEIFDRSLKLATAFHQKTLENKFTHIANIESGILGYYPCETEIEILRNNHEFYLNTFSGTRKRGYSSFDFISDSSSLVGSNPLLRKNNWGASNYEFIDECNSLYMSLSEISKQLSIELLLKINKKLPPSCFNEHCFCLMRLLNYRAANDERTSKEHTDYEFITMIICTGEGLEVKSKEGMWNAVLNKNKLAVILPGDMCEVFSLGHIKSSLHRVKVGKTSRESVIYFQGLPADFHLSLDGCNIKGPNTFGDHIFSMILKGSAHLEPYTASICKQMNITIPPVNPFKANK
jgi:isopenicillin N synthase-like dioxygenase